MSRFVKIFIDTETRAQIDAKGNFVSDGSKIQMFYDETFVLNVQFCKVKRKTDGVYLENVAFPAATEFSIVANVIGDIQNSLLFSVAGNGVNAAGDWDGTTTTADLSKGEVSFKVNTKTTRVKEILTARQDAQNCVFAISAISATEAERSVVARVLFSIAYIPFFDASLPDSDDTRFYTKEEVDSAIAAISGGATIIDFSVDGEIWGASYLVAKYYRLKISPAGVWSEKIPIPGVIGAVGEYSHIFDVPATSSSTEIAVTWEQIGCTRRKIGIFLIQNDGSYLDISYNSRIQIVSTDQKITFYWANDAFPAGKYCVMA